MIINRRLKPFIKDTNFAKEIEQREKNLYAYALEVEKDNALNKEMKAWDAAISDGLKKSKHQKIVYGKCFRFKNA